ncbi:hypothetical protein ES319_A02G011500v1 [Gossypium barbadense]|uniref:Uncharacterized protein n=1 Tax=Gossypium barbadense TaxID=3634 RepID=A0A5J5WHQ6_GOSBA|nr:hypothetical protein ES319_A02G011500v1 [Gossypium barbadense]
MDFRQDNGFSHVVSWCKKITGAKYRKKIYPALKPKTEYLFDLRDSVKEEMIKELMVGTKRTKEFREWLIKVSEFEINARELLQFHEKTSDNLRFSKKQPHADLMNVLDEITRLLESSPLQRATRTRSSSMIEGKSFGLAERTSNAYLRSKTEDPLDKYLEDGRSCATGKEVERDKEIPLIKYGRKLRLQRKVEGDQKPRIRTRKRGSSQAETKDGSTTTVGSMIDMEAPLSGNSGSFWLKPSLIPSSLSPWDRVDLKTKSEEVSSSLTNILPTAGHEIELISFEEGEEEEEEMKPSLRPEIFKAVLNEIEEISSSHETESETSLPAASRIPESLKTVNQSDVWESIDLEAVGIPDPSSENGSAIILATRNLEVCDNMRFINMIEVGTLSNEEAWKLFCEQVGRVVNIPGILPFARVIVERCGGLPLLVIVTGRALSGEEDVFAWEQAFKQFSGPCGDLRNRNDVIQLLKFSFDRLEVHDIQSCFLHCAFFPEDQEEKGSQFLLRAYSKPVSQENHSSLILRESPENNRLFIPYGCQFILRAGSRLTQPPSVEEWGNSPSCPGLLTLFLQRNFRLRVIPVSFFDCMPCLKVLNLSNTRIKSLPRTISKLVSLETLILRHCERLSMLPSDIGSLKLLQVLDLRGTEINLLPDEIRELSSLTYFDICFYGSINRSEHLKLPQGLISSGIISRLSTLQSLGIRVCPGDERWDKCVKSIIYEVSKLTGLTSLSFYFPEVELLELFLQKYNFVVGRDIKRIVSRVPQYVELDYDQTSQRLRFVNGEKIPDAIVKVLAYCSAFYLDHHLDVISISKFGIANMNKLKHCIVSECPTVKAVLDDKEFTEVVFPCLEHLDLHYLWNLEYICNDLLPEGSFTMLRILYVHACPKLKYVLKSSMLRFFLNLEELIVDDCTAIEKIILDDDMTTELSHMSDSSFKRLTLHYLPALVTIREGVWPSFEYISVCNCPNFKKINLDSKSKHTLKGIKGEKDWWDSLEWKEPSLSIHFNDLFTLVSEDDI